MQNKVFANQAASINDVFPKLQLVECESVSIISGEIDIIDNQGKLWESYQVEIHPSGGFPYCFPLVYEVGNKIPRIIDWHVNPSGTCCIGVRPDEAIKCKNGISILHFIKNEMIPYFFNQTYRRIEGYYPNGEWAHYEEGVFQFYERMLKTNNPIKIVRLLKFIAAESPPKRIDKCFCGNGRSYRKCHQAAYEKLIGLGRDYLNDEVLYLEKSIQWNELTEKN